MKCLLCYSVAVVYMLISFYIDYFLILIHFLYGFIFYIDSLSIIRSHIKSIKASNMAINENDMKNIADFTIVFIHPCL